VGGWKPGGLDQIHRLDEAPDRGHAARLVEEAQVGRVNLVHEAATGPGLDADRHWDEQGVHRLRDLVEAHDPGPRAPGVVIRPIIVPPEPLVELAGLILEGPSLAPTTRWVHVAHDAVLDRSPDRLTAQPERVV